MKIPDLHDIRESHDRKTMPGVNVWWADPTTLDRDRDPALRVGSLDDVRDHPFEHVPPVVTFKQFKNMRNQVGWWFSSTMQRHVGHESFLERAHLILFDFDPTVVGIASQPFWLSTDVSGTTRFHVPDYCLRLNDGRFVVVDVRAEWFLDNDDFKAQQKWTREACEHAGWDYLVLSEPENPFFVNVEWLAGYRNPLHDPTGAREQLLAACTEPTPLIELVERVGVPQIVNPHLFQLLWEQRLTADLHGEYLETTTVIHPTREVPPATTNTGDEGHAQSGNH